MNFESISKEILDKVGDSTDHLFSLELIKKVHTFTKDYKFNFDNEVKDAAQITTLELASAEKDKGTKFFRNNMLQESCETYTGCLKMCHQLSDSEDKSKLIYQVYANRSAVLFKANRYTSCLDDVQAALHYSLNPQLDYMIHDRRARCFMFMKEWNKARRSFQEALNGVGKTTDLDKRIQEAFVVQVETNIKRIPTEEMVDKFQANPEDDNFLETEDENFVMDDNDFLIKLKGVHGFHPGLSDKILVKYDETRGRYTVANEDINAGDVIAVENSNVSFTHYNNESQESKACHHCVCPLDVFKHPSPVVPGIYFCSWKCLNIAMKSYHKHEKHILKDYIKQCAEDEKIERSGVLFLALKAVAKMPWQFYCDNSRSELFMQTDPRFGLEMNKDELDKDETKIIHLFNLVTHESEIPSLERTKTAVRSIILLESLKQTDYFKGVTFLEDELTREELALGTLLYKLQLGCTHNVHLIYRLAGDVSGGIPLDMVGSAIYQNCVLLNHSCAANTTRLFQGGQMVLVAKRSIKKGQEVTNNYGVHHNNIPCGKRQSILQRGYKFQCQCPACQGDYPLLNKIESGLSKKVGKELDVLIAQYQKLFSEGCLEEALDRCCDYIKKLEQHNIEYPHRNYEIGSIAMNSCWWGIISRQTYMSSQVTTE